MAGCTPNTSGRRSWRVTAPSVAVSIATQCFAGTRRPSSVHWCTAAFVMPSLIAKAFIEPSCEIAVFSGSELIVRADRFVSRKV